jgi:hypothetical protein
MKLWGGNSKSNFAAYSKLAIVGMGVVGDPSNVVKNFVTNQPELAHKLNDVINVVGKLGQNDPQLATQVNQLKNILGTLNSDGTNQFPPQDGGGWPSSPPAPQNNQYPYAGPTNTNTAPNQYSQYQTLPAQQLPQSAPPSNQPSNWQWPGANQSYTGDGQPAQFQNQYDTAQRPMGQYPQ